MRILTLTALLAAAVLIGEQTIGGVSAAATDCAAMGGTPEADNICHVHAADSGYTMDLRFPTNYADEQAILDYLTQNRDGFTNVAQTPAVRNVAYEMDVTTQSFTSGPPTGGTQSVVLKLFQDVGGAHPTTWYKAFNYDVAHRKPVAFDTLFPPDAKPSTRYSRSCNANWSARPVSPGGRSPPATGWTRRTTRTSPSPTTR